MSEVTCSVPGCERPRRKREWCKMHYERWRLHGSPGLPLREDRRQPPAVRFWSHVVVGGPSECWQWMGAVDGAGYGRFYLGHSGKRAAHRWAWEQQNGPVPEGLRIDHVCHDPDVCHLGIRCPHRRCVNPDHMRLVTPRENVLSGRSNSPCALNGQKTHCPQGHEYTPENTRPKMSHGKVEGRICRICHREQQRRRKASGRRKSPA